MPFESDVLRIESMIGETLPEDYRCFLLASRRRSVAGLVFDIAGGGSSILRDMLDLPTPHVGRGDNAADRVLTIGWDLGDNSLALDLSSGAVLWFDHESLAAVQIASSFHEFLQNLREAARENLPIVERVAKEGPIEEFASLLAIWGDAPLGDGQRTLAQEAARYGNVVALECCVRAGVSLSGCLHLASMNEHGEAVRFLVDAAGVDVNERNAKGWTALGCVMFDEDLAAWLRSRGAR